MTRTNPSDSPSLCHAPSSCHQQAPYDDKRYSVVDEEIRGSTTIVELLRRYPGGEAAELMSALSWACAHCGGAFHEPLTMAAKRHACDPRAVLDAFRALDEPGGPDEKLVARAAARHPER